MSVKAPDSPDRTELLASCFMMTLRRMCRRCISIVALARSWLSWRCVGASRPSAALTNMRPHFPREARRAAHWPPYFLMSLSNAVARSDQHGEKLGGTGGVRTMRSEAVTVAHAAWVLGKPDIQRSERSEHRAGPSGRRADPMRRRAHPTCRRARVIARLTPHRNDPGVSRKPSVLQQCVPNSGTAELT